MAQSKNQKKRLLQHRWIRWALVNLIWCLIQIITRTIRWEVVGHEHRQATLERNTGIIAFWHGRLIGCPMLVPKPRDRFHIITSNHRDGALVAEFAARFGLSIIKGSTGKSGSLAATKICRNLLKEPGSYVAFTPDGPRGPRMRIQGIMLHLAKETGLPILGVSWSTKRHIMIRSWDRFMIPLPFTKGAVAYAPITCEEDLIALSHKTDAMVGIAPVMPQNLGLV